jgi:signal recognition particle subunit SRP54
MADMMKSVAKGKGGLAKMFGLGGGMPEITPEMVEAAKNMPGGMPSLPPGGLSGLPGLPGLPKGFPGLGGGVPGLPGKKK